MARTEMCQFCRIVELLEGAKVQTSIKEPNLPALRSGFAGYPINPRWSAAKVIAWRTGRQWRNALNNGTMAIRSSDSMLVEVTE